jgi:CheY-like chemotaxis protein
LRLEKRLPERPLIAFADGTRIAQVLINLLNNALKFTPPGGTISLELTEQTNRAVLTVRDNGVGISRELLPQVFRMFYQAETVSPPVKTGLGIGLALARVLVEMHEGSIEAYSAGEGQGAEFTVRLPLVSFPAAEQTSTKRILLVDDNPDHLYLLAMALKLKGYEVVTAADAAEALHRAAEDRPYACIIDIGLPDTNGYELARRLRSLPQSQDARLIAVTGYGTLADEQLYNEAGFDHYLAKPPDLDQLIQALN